MEQGALYSATSATLSMWATQRVVFFLMDPQYGMWSKALLISLPSHTNGKKFLEGVDGVDQFTKKTKIRFQSRLHSIGKNLIMDEPATIVVDNAYLGMKIVKQTSRPLYLPLSLLFRSDGSYV